MDTEKKDEVIAEAPPVEEISTTENPAVPNDTASDPTPPVAEVKPTEVAPETPAASTTEEKQPVDKTKIAKQPKLYQAPVGVVLTAVVIATALAGLTVFTYMRSSPPADAPTAKSSTQPAAAETLQASEVDSAVSEAETSVNTTNDETDFSDKDLSDTSLGL